MNWSRLQTIVVAMLLLVVTSYCATECTLAPCHAKATQPPPCHQQQQPKQDEAPPNCLHSQLVMDAQVDVAVSFDLAPFDYLLPLESLAALAPIQSGVAIPNSISPPPSPQLALITILRV